MIKQQYTRDQTEATFIFNLMRVYYEGAILNQEATNVSQQQRHLENALLLADQFCLGDQLSSPAASSSAYRQSHLNEVILLRIYDKLFVTRQYEKALDYAEYLHNFQA